MILSIATPAASANPPANPPASDTGNTNQTAGSAG